MNLQMCENSFDTSEAEDSISLSLVKWEGGLFVDFFLNYFIYFVQSSVTCSPLLPYTRESLLFVYSTQETHESK